MGTFSRAEFLVKGQTKGFLMLVFFLQPRNSREFPHLRFGGFRKCSSTDYVTSVLVSFGNEGVLLMVAKFAKNSLGCFLQETPEFNTLIS